MFQVVEPLDQSLTPIKEAMLAVMKEALLAGLCGPGPVSK